MKRNADVIFLLVVASLCAAFLLFALSGCGHIGNKEIVDLTYTFDYAIISLPNGDVIEGEVESWKDYEGDQIQVKIDGNIYLVHSINVALIQRK